MSRWLVSHCGLRVCPDGWILHTRCSMLDARCSMLGIGWDGIDGMKFDGYFMILGYISTCDKMLFTVTRTRSTSLKYFD